MLYSLLIDDIETSSFKTRPEAMQSAQDNELLELQWSFLKGGGVEAQASSSHYKITKNTLVEIALMLDLPNFDRCKECEYFLYESQTHDSPEFSDCNVNSLIDCPVIEGETL